MEDEYQAFWAVIPACVIADERLSANAKILYGQISTMTKREGYCWASNQRLAKGNKWSPDTVSRLISMLEKNGYIRTDFENDAKTGGTIRKIRIIMSVLDGQSVDTPSAELQMPPSAKKSSPPLQKSRVIYNDLEESIEESNTPTPNPKKVDVGAQMVEFAAKYGQAVQHAMSEFIAMRKEIGKPLKSQRSANMLWKNMLQLSGGNPATMVQLFELAIARQWITLYPLRNEPVPTEEIPERMVDVGGIRML